MCIPGCWQQGYLVHHLFRKCGDCELLHASCDGVRYTLQWPPHTMVWTSPPELTMTSASSGLVVPLNPNYCSVETVNHPNSSSYLANNRPSGHSKWQAWQRIEVLKHCFKNSNGIIISSVRSSSDPVATLRVMQTWIVSLSCVELQEIVVILLKHLLWQLIFAAM